MRILIRDFEFEAIIGILEEERRSPQRVSLDLEIEYCYQDGKYIDYIQLTQLLKSLIVEKRYLLLEDALEDILATLKSTFPSISFAKCQISKPDIIKECRILVQTKKRF